VHQALKPPLAITLHLLDGYEGRYVSGCCLAVAVRDRPYNRTDDRRSLVYSVRPDGYERSYIIVNPSLSPEISRTLETEGEGIPVRVSSHQIEVPTFTSKTTGKTSVIRFVQHECSRTESKVVELLRKVRIVVKASVGPTSHERTAAIHLASPPTIRLTSLPMRT
jgi:hypothetical protein